MKDWYLRQSPRDRMIVIAVAVLTVISLVYALGWYPLQSRLDDTRQAIISKTETLDFVRRSAATIKARGGTTAAPVQQSDKAPYLLIDEKIRAAGLTQPERVEPSGDNGARVTFGEVEFDKLVQVLAELETYGLRITTMNLTRRNAGTVSARISMERG